MQQLLRFSTDALPERDRIAIWAEVLGRYVVKAQFETIGDGAFYQNATLRSLPGLSLASGSGSGFRASRTSELVADGNDNLNLAICIDGTAEFRQLGREALVGARGAVYRTPTRATSFPQAPRGPLSSARRARPLPRRWEKPRCAGCCREPRSRAC